MMRLKNQSVWKHSQTLCITFLKWQTKTSMESIVSTNIWSCHFPH